MIDVCDHYGLELNRQGFTRCPFHSEKTASFKAYPGERGFYCFGCHAAGDVITFVRQYFGLTFWESLTKLNEDFKLGLPINGATPSQVYHASVMLAKRRTDRLNRQYELRSARQEYDRAFDAFADADRTIQLHDPNAELTDEYVAALKRIDRLSAELEDARVRLYEAERR